MLGKRAGNRKFKLIHLSRVVRMRKRRRWNLKRVFILEIFFYFFYVISELFKGEDWFELLVEAWQFWRENISGKKSYDQMLKRWKLQKILCISIRILWVTSLFSFKNLFSLIPSKFAFFNGEKKKISMELSFWEWRLVVEKVLLLHIEKLWFKLRFLTKFLRKNQFHPIL